MSLYRNLGAKVVQIEKTLELRIFWVFPANPACTNKLLLLKLRGIALIDGNYIRYIGHCIINGLHREAITIKVCLTPRIS